MRRSLAIALAVFAAVAVPAFAATKYTAKLNGKSETPKSDSKATGTATLTVATNGKSIKYTLRATGLSGGAQAAHVHAGKAGAAGPVILNICPKPCKLPKSGTLTSTQFAKAPGVANFKAAINAIKKGRAYVNIHTKEHPAGEIRGQIKKG